MESDSGIGTRGGSSSGKGAGSSGHDSASTMDDTGSTTMTNDTLQDQSQRSGSSGFFSNPNGGNNHQSYLDALPKQDMIELFLRRESESSQDKEKAVRIQIRPDQTITELQEKVQKVTGVHPGQQYLVHEGTKMVLSGRTNNATRTIGSCNIKHGSSIKYSARNRGGGGGVC